jgi:SPP1 gp7 family putative phage head morphogenesis protein
VNTQELYDDAVGRAVAVVRYENQMVADARPTAMRTQNEVVDLIASAPATRNPVQLASTERGVRSAIRDGVGSLRAEATDDLEEFAEIEASRESAVTGTDVAVSAALIYAALRQPYEGRTIGEWFHSLSVSVQTQVLKRMRLGILTGQDPAAVARQFLGARGIARSLLAGHSAVTRTMLTGVWNHAREWLWRLNPRIDRVQWRSVLDGRTSDICLNRHGRIYPVRQGPRPPAHVRCRSMVIPIRRGEEPPVEEGFAGWLRRQPPQMVEEVLGPTRARAYLAGEFTVDQFFNNKGLRYTLAQLRARYSGGI